MRRRTAVLLIVAVFGAGCAQQLASPPPARADVLGFGCSLLGTIGEGWWGTACKKAVGVGGKVVGVGKKILGIGKKVAGSGLAKRALGLAAIVAWVLGGAKWTMDHMASVISSTTSPALTASWFTGVYLRIEALALFFTLLFLCAAAVESLLRSDGALLAKAAFGYLPAAALLTALATPITMLLLLATDRLSSGLAAVAGGGATHFVTGTSAWVVGGLTAVDPFFAVLAAGIVVAAGGALWVEMLIREVAVYVVVAMLPLVFAAMVWPARRVWAVRAVEVLVALILAKIAIVVVLALGGAALSHSGAGGLSKLLGGLALVVLGAFSPWLLLRLIPLAEVASAAVGHIRGHVHASTGVRTPEAALAGKATESVRNHAGQSGNGRPTTQTELSVSELLEQMHRRAQTAEGAGVTAASPPTGTMSNGLRRSLRDDPATGGQVPPLESAASDQRSGGEMFIQNSDGSWNRRPHSDPAGPPAPPPGDEPSPPMGLEPEAPDPPGPILPGKDDPLDGGGHP
jgi:hypothetical protein